MTQHSPLATTTAMVLAAGLGTRLRPLTDTTPKPLLNVGQEPVLLRTLRMLAAAGLQRVVINTHFLAPQIEQAVKAVLPQLVPPGSSRSIMVQFSFEPDLLDTGGGIKNALPLLGEGPLLVVNSDAVWFDEETPLLRPLLQHYDVNKHDTLLAVVPTTQTQEFQPRGDFKLDPRSHELHRDGPREQWDAVYASVHVTHTGLLARMPERIFGLMKVWEPSMQQGRLHGWLYSGRWAEIGTPAGLQAARMMAQR